MSIVSTIPEKCKRCYTCVRECPAKAIKVESGQATVIAERCIVCGNCVKVCAQQAKLIEDGTAQVKRMLSGDRRVFACLAPSFPAAFDQLRPGQVVAAIRHLGFDQVWEVAVGAELVSREYARLFDKSKPPGRRVIATPCPAIVSYIAKYMPSLCDALAPVVSPMIAVGRAIRQRHGADVRVAFIGPCIAKKNELEDPCVAGAVDAVLSFKELVELLEEARIDPAVLPESRFDGPACRLGQSYALSGGLLKAAGLSADILENDTVVTEGKDRVLAVLRELTEGHSRARFFDLLFCEGCISGPRMLNDLSVFARKEILADFVRGESGLAVAPEAAEPSDEFAALDLGRSFTCQDLTLPQPTREQLTEALRMMRKEAPHEELNCGACGYPTCREKAIAVCQGLAEAEMCLPYLVEKLEATCGQLKESHEELASAQERLVVTEKLASMGQLSAGVAHEINNPLGAILLFSHMLLKGLREDDPRRPDFQMIVNEATRCKNIVRGLLDFARQSRVSKAPTDLAALVQDVLAIVDRNARAAGVRITCSVEDGLPPMMIDETQIKQVLVNLVQNGMDAAPAGGRVRIAARLAEPNKTVEIQVADNGCGIPPENLSRVFAPFFTTKEMGKGTGLGLAIAYGIVKMHYGDISVASEKDKGATFTVRLPIGRDEAEEETGTG
ncbi:MAG: [Fe-Fe] hydrogenase large subunit C-terminal domain-containing protein [Pirellulales bacterium]